MPGLYLFVGFAPVDRVFLGGLNRKMAGVAPAVVDVRFTVCITSGT